MATEIIPYITRILAFVGIYLICALGLQINLGYTGLSNFGFGVYFAFSSYVYAISERMLNNPLISIILAFLSGFLLSIIHYCVSKKLNGESFVIVSLALLFIVNTVVINWKEVTNGPIGIFNIKGFVDMDNLTKDIYVIIVSVFFVLFFDFIRKNKISILLQSYRDNQKVASSIGIDNRLIKLSSLIISSIFFSMAGVLYAQLMGFIDPNLLKTDWLIIVYSIVIIAGLTSLEGSIIVSLIMICLPELFRFLNIQSIYIDSIRKILFGLALIGFMYFRPKGLFGKIEVK
ncbi:MAG: branched-chain amino acid ABC transporter permease [Patescibacteria group bacterium]